MHLFLNMSLYTLPHASICPKFYIHIYIYIYIIYISLYIYRTYFIHNFLSSLLFFIFIIAFLIVVSFFFRTVIVYSFHCGHARQAWTDHSAALTAASVVRYAMYLLAQAHSQETPSIIYKKYIGIFTLSLRFHVATVNFVKDSKILFADEGWWNVL